VANKVYHSRPTSAVVRIKCSYRRLTTSLAGPCFREYNALHNVFPDTVVKQKGCVFHFTHVIKEPIPAIFFIPHETAITLTIQILADTTISYACLVV